MPDTDRFALVTGASRGTGRAIALGLATCGHRVAVHHHTRRDAAEQVLAEIRERGGDGFTVSADVIQDDHDSMAALAEPIAAHGCQLSVRVLGE